MPDEPEEDDRRRSPSSPGSLARRLRDAGGQQRERGDRRRAERPRPAAARRVEVPPRQQARRARSRQPSRRRRARRGSSPRAARRRAARRRRTRPRPRRAAGPVTRCSWKIANASTAMKIGTDAWMIDASPESSRVSPHESSQNGSAVLSSPIDDEPAPVRAQLRGASRVRPASARTKTTSAIAAEPDAAEHERRRRHVAHGHLDEHERAAPDQADRREQQQVANRRALVRAAADVARSGSRAPCVARAGHAPHPRRADPGLARREHRRRSPRVHAMPDS